MCSILVGLIRSFDAIQEKPGDCFPSRQLVLSNIPTINRISNHSLITEVEYCCALLSGTFLSTVTIHQKLFNGYEVLGFVQRLWKVIAGAHSSFIHWHFSSVIIPSGSILAYWRESIFTALFQNLFQKIIILWEKNRSYHKPTLLFLYFKCLHLTIRQILKHL